MRFYLTTFFAEKKQKFHKKKHNGHFPFNLLFNKILTNLQYFFKNIVIFTTPTRIQFLYFHVVFNR